MINQNRPDRWCCESGPDTSTKGMRIVEYSAVRGGVTEEGLTPWTVIACARWAVGFWHEVCTIVYASSRPNMVGISDHCKLKQGEIERRWCAIDVDSHGQHHTTEGQLPGSASRVMVHGGVVQE